MTTSEAPKGGILNHAGLEVGVSCRYATCRIAATSLAKGSRRPDCPCCNTPSLFCPSLLARLASPEGIVYGITYRRRRWIRQKTFQIPMSPTTVTIPYQNLLAAALPNGWYEASASRADKKLVTCVVLEKSTLVGDNMAVSHENNGPGLWSWDRIAGLLPASV